MKLQQDKEFSLVNKIPESISLERGVLGSIILDGKSFNRIKDILNEHDFVLAQHRTMFRVLSEIISKNSIIDINLLMDYLKSNDLMEKIGGEIYLIDLMEKQFLPVTLDEAVKTIKMKSVRRKQYELTIELLSKLKEDFQDTPNEIDRILSNIVNVNKFTLDNPYLSLNDASRTYLFEVIEKHITGLSCGFPSIDAHIGGLYKGQLITIAAETSMGKTTFAWQIAMNVAKANTPVAYTSLEMSTREMIGKAFSIYTGVPYLKQQELKIDSDELQEMKRIHKDIFSKFPLYISEKTLTIYDIKRSARKLKSEYDIQLLIVDHLHFIQNKKESETRNQEISFMTSELKALAKELDIPIIILSQLNRAGSSRLVRSPILTDLRDSGSIEQDSDVVMFIYRPGVHTLNEEPENRIDIRHTEIIIPKNRNGERNVKIKMAFSPESSLFSEDPFQEEEQEYSVQSRAFERADYYSKD